MLSMIPCASRQAKKASRASQQMVRALRLGASKAPSWEGLGTLGGGEVDGEKRPIVGLGGWGWGVGKGGKDRSGDGGWVVWERDGDVGWMSDRVEEVG